MKTCRVCKQSKELIEFHKHNRCPQGVAGTCRKCLKKKRDEKFLNLSAEERREKIESERNKTRLYYKNNKQKSETASRNSKYKRDFGITIEEYDILFEKQKGLCKICGKPETAYHQSGKLKILAIDHCHKTGKVRGLLCSRHNVGLGYFQDNIELLKKAIEYLSNV